MFTNTDRARSFSLSRLLRIFGLAAATMLLLLLLHLLLHQILSSAKDVNLGRDVGYFIEHIETCPSKGFYFKRQTIPNAVDPELCYLCFCQDDNTAVCWKRDNRRCDAASYYTQRDKREPIKKKYTRFRRSPGFADLFFRDATRDVFNKNSEPQCKPFESSFSDDCPPADWCIGCTVCDCDANGRWDCHLLSFCPDKKSKHNKNNKNDARKIVHKKRLKPTKPTKPKPTTKSPVKKRQALNKIKIKPTTTTYNGNFKNPPIKRDHQKQQIRLNPNNKGEKRIFKKSVPAHLQSLIGNQNLIAVTRNKATNKVTYKRVANPKTNPKEKKIIKKNVATHSPVDLGKSKSNLNLEKAIARTLMQRVMGNLKHSMDDMAYTLSQKQNSSKGKKKQVKKPQKKTPKTPYRKPYRKPPAKPYKWPNKSQKKLPKKPPPKKYRGNRKKRDLSVVGLTSQTEETVTTKVIPGNYTNIIDAMPLTTPTAISLNSTRKVTNFTKRYIEDKNVTGSEYYKYTTIDESNALIKKVTEDNVEGHTNGINQNKNVTLTVLNLIGTELLPTVYTEITHPIPYEKTKKPKRDDNIKINMLPELSPEENDIKFSKWPTLKVSQEAELTLGSEKHKTVLKMIAPLNKTDFDEYKKRVYAKDVEKSLWTKLHNRRHGLIKLLSLPKAISTMPVKKNITTSTVHSAGHSTVHTSLNKKQFLPKIEELQNFLAKLMKDLNKRNVTEEKPPNKSKKPNKKARKFNVVRYLKKIFNKLFRRKKTSKRYMNHQIIETLCESFGPCKISLKDKPVLKSKLTQLDAETKKILRLVKIIKGLLKLIDLPLVSNRKLSKKQHLHSEIKKLNDILKGDYSKNNNASLTTAQVTQIDYIKKNTHEFVKSVSKFASLLNEIIDILTKGNKHQYKTGSRMMRHTDRYSSKNLIRDNPFHDLRMMLEKYNLAQNKFMKQMYEQLNNFETKLNDNPKVSDVQYQNNTVAIEKFSRNIVENLRKLKSLAQMLSYNGRHKREVPRDDDAIEYLLMLMEYLLKQQHPLDAAPVNDGIDLLIEAIKNAPDIKPIKKKVLEYTPAPTPPTVLTTPLAVFVNTDPPSDEESPSESDKTSSEDQSKPKLDDAENTVKQKIEEYKETLDIVPEDDKMEIEDKYPVDRRVDRMEDITEVAYYKRVEDNIVESDNAYETSTSPTPEVEIGERMIDREEPIQPVKRLKVVESNNNVEKPTVEGGVDERKFEVFTGDIEDEIAIPGGVLISSTDLPSYMTEKTERTEVTTQSKKSKSKMRHLNLESFDSESIDKKSKLEWIEENFGKESERDFRDMDENNTTISVTVTEKTTSAKTTAKQDVSAVSHELSDGDKKKKAKLNAEDVMFKKQMDLLNSLDYGTEKGEVEDSDSKDGNAEDRFSSDTFPSYFV